MSSYRILKTFIIFFLTSFVFVNCERSGDTPTAYIKFSRCDTAGSTLVDQSYFITSTTNSDFSRDFPTGSQGTNSCGGDRDCPFHGTQLTNISHSFSPGTFTSTRSIQGQADIVEEFQLNDGECKVLAY